MRRLQKLDEFKQEAANALFTKSQAIAVTLQLLAAERDDPSNSAEETEIFKKALGRAEFRYIDATQTQTDRMLDSCGVARITAPEIVDAIHAILFDAG